MSTGFARDYMMHAEMCAKDGRITGLRVDVIADHGAFDSTAQPTKFPAGFFHICCGSYDLQASHVKVKAVYTNKAPGGVAYRCSFRITEAVYLVERMVDALALEMGDDPIDLRMRSFIAPEQFPYETTTGWTYDSGNYAETMKVAMDIAGYDDLRREQAEKRARGELMGIGVSFFTEGVGAGPRKHMDILGLSMNDGADLRVHPSGKAVVSASARRPRARATRRRSRRSSPRSSASRPRTSRSATATPTSRPTASARTAAARRRCPARRSRSSRARCATRRG